LNYTPCAPRLSRTAIRGSANPYSIH